MVRGFNIVLSKLFPHQSSVQDDQTANGTGSTAQFTSAIIPGKEKLKDAAKKASDIAKAKSGMYASCSPSQV